ETLPEEMAQEAAALRDAEGVGALDGGFAVAAAQGIFVGGVVPQKGDEIARRRKASPLHDGTLRLTNQFVENTRLQSAFELEAHFAKRATHALLYLCDGQANERPLVARHFLTGILFMHAPGKFSCGFSLFGGRIAAVSGAARKR